MSTAPLLINLDLFSATKLAYNPSGIFFTNFIKEKENQEYGAYEFEFNSKKIKFRVGKITPTKIGQFVTLWKRNENGIIIPYDLEDCIDFFIISVRSGEDFGQFVFPKLVLLTQNILSKDGKGGKRAMRVYPPWDKVESKQAEKTQNWQLKYFFKIPIDRNILRVQELLR